MSDKEGKGSLSCQGKNMRRIGINLSEEEKYIVSEGLLSLMANANALKSILHDIDVNEALDAYIGKIKKLNDKVIQSID